MPFMGFHTWYRIVEGENTDRPPLLLLHGGPGSTHNYFELLDDICETGRIVISYDQLGCGESYLDGHPELWNMNTWLNELIAIREFLHLKQVHILGQSFGGMLLLEYLLLNPEGVCSAILSSTLPASWLWAKEQHRMIRFLSEKEQSAISKAESSGIYDDPDYLEANSKYMDLHCASTPTEDSPECLRRVNKPGEEAYITAWGPNEYTPMGTLRSYDVIDRLTRIRVPSLIISGTDDLCTPLIAKTMADRIPDARWELMENCRHMCFSDNQEGYMKLMKEWLPIYDE